MQPQGPYGPQQPYTPPNPAGPVPGGQIPVQYGPDGQPLPPLPGQTYPPAPGSAIQPGSQPLPGQPQPGQAPTPGQPLTPPQPQIPGQPPVPAYQMPAHLQATQPDDLPPPPAAPTTPYDFFMEQPKPMPGVNPLPVKGKHMGNIPTNGPIVPQSNPKAKFLLIVGGAIGLVIVLFTALALMPKDPAGEQLFGIAQAQQEIIRVCTDGTKHTKLRATRNFAVTCATSVRTSQKELSEYMTKAGYGYNAKKLGQKENPQTSSKLQSAKSASSYDNTFREIMQTQLTAYDRSLTSQLATTTGQNGRAVLSKNQQANLLLIQMVKDNSDKTEAAPATAE